MYKKAVIHYTEAVMAEGTTSKRAVNTRMVWIDSELHRLLKEKAGDDRRTIRSTLEIILQESLGAKAA